MPLALTNKWSSSSAPPQYCLVYNLHNKKEKRQQQTQTTDAAFYCSKLLVSDQYTRAGRMA